MLTTSIRHRGACMWTQYSGQRQWHARPPHPRLRIQPVRASMLDAGDPSDTWERLQLLTQQLDVAVQGEDFKLAAQLRDQCKVLKEQLSPVQQYQYYQVQQLRSGTAEERAAAINALRETGSAAALPHLASCLSDPGLNPAAETAMWAIFLRCSQPRAAELLQQGMRFMSNGADLRRALEAFDQVIVCEPSFAEGYNKRATVLYLLGRFQESVEECRTVLSLNPYHFGAASGMGLCYMQLRRLPDALAAFELALSINPGMQQIQQYAELLRQQQGEAVSEE